MKILHVVIHNIETAFLGRLRINKVRNLFVVAVTFDQFKFNINQTQWTISTNFEPSIFKRFLFEILKMESSTKYKCVVATTVEINV